MRKWKKISCGEVTKNLNNLRKSKINLGILHHVSPVEFITTVAGKRKPTFTKTRYLNRDRANLIRCFTKWCSI